MGESKHINDESDTLTLVEEEYSNEASSGKDWKEKIFNFLTFLNHKVCLNPNINRNAINNK